MITATATETLAGGPGTSEFSRCSAVEPMVTASVDLTAPGTVPAGAARVPLKSVPPAMILGSSGQKIESAPLADTPLSDTPLSDTDVFGAPLADTPLAGTPLSDTGLTDYPGLLQTIPLSTLPLLRAGGWPALLANTTLNDRPLQEVTLGDVIVRYPRLLDDVKVNELDFANSPLGSLTPIAVTLGAMSLVSMEILPGLTDDERIAAAAHMNLQGPDDLTEADAWCYVLRAAPISCSPAHLVVTGQTTIMSSSLSGAPLSDTPLADTPLADTPLSGTPLSGTPLAGTPLADTPLADTPLADTRIGQTPLSGTPLSGTPLSGTALIGTPFATPLSGTPLSGTPLSDTPLSDTPLSDTPLSGTATRSTPLSGTPLADTPLSGTLLYGADLSNAPLSGTLLSGVFLTGSPLSGTSVSQISHLEALFVCGVGGEPICPMTGTIESNALQARAAATLGALVNALSRVAADGLSADDLLLSLGPGALAERPNDRTLTVGDMLSELFRDSQLGTVSIWTLANNIPGFTFGELVASLQGFENRDIEDLLGYLVDVFPQNAFTVADILALLLSPQATGWETLDLGASRPQSLPGVDGGVADYVAQIRLDPPPELQRGRPRPHSYAMDLPPEFAYVEGSSKVGAAAVTDPDVLDAPSSGTPTRLEWRLRLPVGQTVNLTFRARAGITLGPAKGTIVVEPANGAPAPDDATIVVVGDTFEENGTVAFGRAAHD